MRKIDAGICDLLPLNRTFSSSARFGKSRFSLIGNFLVKPWPCREPPPKCFKELVVPLPACCTGRSLRGLRKRRGRIEPKADEQSKGFIGNADVTLQPLDIAVNAIKTLRNACLLPFVSIWREKRCNCCLGYKRTRLTSPLREIGKTTHQLRIKVGR